MVQIHGKINSKRRVQDVLKGLADLNVVGEKFNLVVIGMQSRKQHQEMYLH